MLSVQRIEKDRGCCGHIRSEMMVGIEEKKHSCRLVQEIKSTWLHCLVRRIEREWQPRALGPIAIVVRHLLLLMKGQKKPKNDVHETKIKGQCSTNVAIR